MKRTHREVMKAILKVLSDGREHSFADLERKVNTNWQTARDHIENLELFGAVEVNDKNRSKITSGGMKILKKID